MYNTYFAVYENKEPYAPDEDYKEPLDEGKYHTVMIKNHATRIESLMLKINHQVTMAPTKRGHARSQVQALVKTGKSVRDIARLLKMSPTTVLKWKNQTDGSVSDAKRSGRPSKVSPQTKKKNKGVGEGQVNEKKTVNGDYYCTHILPAYSKVLRDTTKFPKQHIAFLMQDGARAHTAKSTLDTIKNSGIKVWTDWPGNSPDLNPIEHLWSRLQESVFRTPRPRNRNELIARVLEEWESITQEDIFRLTDSFGRRVLQCLEKKRM
ncbi:hypothetical protein ANN_23620 [Periplaneta americana]|uniref:Tc1-like transposase DDE domain-containing protein n=1 Tax=Periplaneta americana TaxID=6978 RepID=A0ABQ8SMX5_PERAM|nr:hypothetical protein ANN_23620 [Periplaneta americana]